MMKSVVKTFKNKFRSLKNNFIVDQIFKNDNDNNNNNNNDDNNNSNTTTIIINRNN